MIGFDEVTRGLVVAINDNDFNYVEGIDEVEAFITDYLLTNGYILTDFKSESIEGWRRHLRIWCKDSVYSRGTYLELSVFEKR